MSSHARQQRRQAATRAAILEAAIALAGQEGWSGVTLRKIAERIEYTHAALYTYFATKDDLLLEVLRQGFADLQAALEAARVAAATPQGALRALILAYWNFAWEHQEVYRVMYGLDGIAFGIAFGVAATWSEGEAIGATVAATLQPLFAGQRHVSGDVGQRVIQLWSTIHGVIALVMAGRIAGGADEHRSLALATIQDLLRGWGIASEISPDVHSLE